MNDFPDHVGGYRPELREDNRSIDSDRPNLYADVDNPNRIVTFAPKERFRLGYFDVMCLVLNRTIGK